VETFKRVNEAYRRRDVDAMLVDLDPEIEWHPGLLASLGGEKTIYRGHEGIRELVRDLDEHFAEFNNEFSEIRDVGDQVLAIGQIRARGKASGAETVSRLAFLVESKDNGKAIRVRTYLHPKKALEAAGLSE
jgi:ketosteroid isomerase-like protein